MKKQYKLPEIEVLMFKSEDAILTDSNDGDIDVDGIWGMQVDEGI